MEEWTNFFTALSAVAVAVIAYVGLHTWKRQLKIKTEYDLARRYLITLYRLSAAINSLRGVYSTSEYLGPAFISAKLEQVDFSLYDESEKERLSKKWKLIAEEYSNLEVETFQAEALWGKEASNNLSSMREVVNCCF
jgi:hypothetical protein